MKDQTMRQPFLVRSIALLLPGLSILAHGAFANPYPHCSLDSKSTLPLAGVKSEAFDIATHAAGYKSQSEMNRYFRCWGSSHLSAYETKYKAMIEAAASSSGIPFQILACLFFYESKFNPAAKSQVGATGISQVMPGTWKEIKNDLNPKAAVVGNPYIPSNLKKHLNANSSKQDVAAVDKIASLFKKANGPIKNKNDLIELKNQLEILQKSKTYSGRSYLRQYMVNANTALNRIYSREIYDSYYRKRKSKPVQSLTNAEYAIVMGTIRLRRVYKDLFDLKVSEATHDQWVIAAGAYNIGPGAIRCKSNTSANDCINITKNPETKGHMRGIKNCSEPNNWKDKRNSTKLDGCKV